jgi:hypothetical protein
MKFENNCFFCKAPLNGTEFTDVYKCVSCNTEQEVGSSGSLYIDYQIQEELWIELWIPNHKGLGQNPFTDKVWVPKFRIKQRVAPMSTGTKIYEEPWLSPITLPSILEHAKRRIKILAFR